MCIQNLVEFSPSIFKILSKTQFLTSIKGCNFAALGPIWPKFELCPDLLVFLLPANMKKIQSKMKALEYSQHYTSNFQVRKGR